MDLHYEVWSSKPCEKHKTHSRQGTKLLNDLRLWEIPQFGSTEGQRNLENFPKSSILGVVEVEFNLRVLSPAAT